jgi:putative transposase
MPLRRPPFPGTVQGQPLRPRHLLGLLKYIHQNPLRARITKTLKDYAWSSHHAYDGRNNPLGLVETDQVLRLFSKSKGRARSKYRECREEGSTRTKDEVYATIDQRLQGDEGVVERVLVQYDGPVEGRKRKKEQSLPAIARAIERLHGVPLDAMRAATKQQALSMVRKVFAHTAREYGYRGKEIAEYLEKTPVSVTTYLHHDREINNAMADLSKHHDNIKNVNNNA